MKRIFGSLVGMGLVVICGCERGVPGGSGAAPAKPSQTSAPHTVSKPVLGEAKETFTLSVPTLSTSLKQGETKSVTIGIRRGTNFDEDVTLKIGELPQGVTVDPAQPVIRHGDSEVKMSLTAAADAALGDFTITLTGQPAQGGTDAVNELKLTVKMD